MAVRGHGFSFNAPAGWKVTASATSTSATHDSELLQVSTFPLIHTYTDALFDKVKTELDVRMSSVAKDDGGALGGSRTVNVAGARAHSYDVKVDKDVLEYTFVLRGKREFELLCRRPSSESDATCTQLLRSFTSDL